MSVITADALLGGRVRLRQPAAGLRAGLDAVMLAARVPAAPGERVLELGCGTGAALLCLLARVPAATALGAERDPALAALAAGNLGLNGWENRAAIRAADIGRPDALAGVGTFDHAMANPPYWTGGTPPPGTVRAAATHAEADLPLAAWAGVMTARLRRGGSATLVLPAARHGEGWDALRRAGCGGVSLLPLWPRAGRGAKRVLLRARLGSRAPDAVLPGLVLHDAAGWTAGAEAVLRGEASLAE